jgi:hypothetical protein
MNRGELDQFGYLDSILQFFTGKEFGRITLHWHCNQVRAWPSRMRYLFHRDRFGKITRLVHIGTLDQGNMV